LFFGRTAHQPSPTRKSIARRTADKLISLREADSQADRTKSSSGFGFWGQNKIDLGKKKYSKKRVDVGTSTKTWLGIA
jgi:hypothetical protein